MAAGFAAYGSSVGVGIAGEVGGGVLSEDPDKFGSILILQALPATQSIYGLVVAILVMVKLQILGGTDPLYDLAIGKGCAVFGACIPAMFGELMSAQWQGKVSGASIGCIAKRPETFGRAVILPAMVETFGLFALIATILMLMVGIQL